MKRKGEGIPGERRIEKGEGSEKDEKYEETRRRKEIEKARARERMRERDADDNGWRERWRGGLRMHKEWHYSRKGEPGGMAAPFFV